MDWLVPAKGCITQMSIITTKNIASKFLNHVCEPTHIISQHHGYFYETNKCHNKGTREHLSSLECKCETLGTKCFNSGGNVDSLPTWDGSTVICGCEWYHPITLVVFLMVAVILCEKELSPSPPKKPNITPHNTSKISKNKNASGKRISRLAPSRRRAARG